MLLYQVMESRQEVSDRFYRALYTKLLDQDLKHSKGQVMHLQLFESWVYNFLGNVPKCFVQITEVRSSLEQNKGKSYMYVRKSTVSPHTITWLYI